MLVASGITGLLFFHAPRPVGQHHRPAPRQLQPEPGERSLAGRQYRGHRRCDGLPVRARWLLRSLVPALVSPDNWWLALAPPLLALVFYRVSLRGAGAIVPPAARAIDGGGGRKRLIMDAIRISNLVKKYGTVMAVDNLSLAVPKGSMFGFLGPNGSGKSTTIGCLTGLLDPTAGEIEILGQRVRRRQRGSQAAHGRDAGNARPVRAALRARISGLRGPHVRTGRSHHAQARHRTAGGAGADRLVARRCPNTAPACASAWPSPRP